MDTPAHFDLNESIHKWRKGLAESPAFRPEDLEELEFHVRDSVAMLETKGLSAEEAFWIATRRVGKSELLQAEFGKVNAQEVWLRRVLWMVTGVLAFHFVAQVAGIAADLLVVGFHKLTSSNALAGPAWIIAYAVVLIGLPYCVWRSRAAENEWLARIGIWMKEHPNLAAFIVFGFMLCSAATTRLYHPAFDELPKATYYKMLSWKGLSVFVYPALLWPVFIRALLKARARKAAN